MEVIRAIFYKNGKISSRGYRTHVNDDGLPLCRVMTRNSSAVMKMESCKWSVEFGDLTCPICVRLKARHQFLEASLGQIKTGAN